MEVHPTRSYIPLILLSILLLFALGSTVYAAMTTVRAVQGLQQQTTLAKEGNVEAIRPWMTIPYVAHIYHVPESYLYQSLQLHIDERHPPAHLPLHELATRYKRPVTTVIRQLQVAITSYRQQHPEHYPGTPSSGNSHTLRMRRRSLPERSFF